MTNLAILSASIRALAVNRYRQYKLPKYPALLHVNNHLGQDALLDELLEEGLAGRVRAESEQGGHALVLLLRQVIFVK